MKYYRATASNANEIHFFWVTEDTSTSNPSLVIYNNKGENPKNITKTSGTTICDIENFLKKNYPGHNPKAVESNHKPSDYYPRINRKRNSPPTGKYYSHPWADSVRSVRNILDRLESVFKVVEPSVTNNHAYGHELRHLLILACTEVESAWRSIMVANNYTPTSNWTTIDYVKLKDPLLLDQWEIVLTRTPTYSPLKPFNKWDPAKPTKSLDWYDAYNQTKHDRETKLSEATLSRTINAAGAAYILIWAQFGQFGITNSNLREIDTFQIAKKPIYPLEDQYMPIKIDPTIKNHTPKNYKF